MRAFITTVALASFAALILTGCGRHRVRVIKVKQKKIDFNAPVTGYGPVKATPTQGRAVTNGKVRWSIRTAESLMRSLQYAEARSVLSKARVLDCDADLKARAHGLETQAKALSAMVREFPEKGSARERIVRFETFDGRKLVAQVVDEDDNAYTIRMGKNATAKIGKEELLTARHLPTGELDARYLRDVSRIRGEGGDSHASLMQAARFAFARGVTEPVHGLLVNAYRKDPTRGF